MTEHWVCYDANRPHSPWWASSEKCEGARQAYPSLVQADRRVKRLRRLWILWRWWQLKALLPHPPAGFTRQDFYAAERKLEGVAAVLRAVAGLRKKARRLGLDPDRVAVITGTWPNKKVIGRSTIDQLTEPRVGPPRVGERWKPKDFRRKGLFSIRAIEGDRVVGDDGRVVQLRRLVSRYERAS